MRNFLGNVSGFLLLLLLIIPSAGYAQETVCIQCHSGLPGDIGAPVQLWQGSIHFRNGVLCFHCHGGDPTDFGLAHSPERGFIGAPSEEEIPDFCGRCHVGVTEDYFESAHGQALGAGGPTCVTCHGSHEVQRATSNLINPQDCTRCHEYGRAEVIKESISETEAFITRLEDDVAALHRLGIDTSRLEGNIFSVRNEFRRLFHSVDVERVRSETDDFQQELGVIAGQVEALQSELARRKVWGGAVVILLVLAGVLSLLLYKSYMEGKEG
jgi:hypothetical protein